MTTVLLVLISALLLSENVKSQRQTTAKPKQLSEFPEVPQVASFVTQGTETFFPCKEGVFLMQRKAGLPRDQSNYWEGVLSLKNRTQLSHVTLTIILDAQATLEVDSNEAKVLTNTHGNYFKVEWRKVPPAINHVRFTVRMDPRGDFSNLLSLQLNNLEMCDSPSKWFPTSLNFPSERPPVQSFYAQSSTNPPMISLESLSRPNPIQQESYYTSVNSFEAQRRTTRAPTRTSTRRSTTNWSVSQFGTTQSALEMGQRTKKPDTEQPRCGQRQIKHEEFVTHGHEAKHGDWPWHAAVYHKKGRNAKVYKCGGTLIASDTVLTAAHCLLDNGHVIIAARVTVKLGMHKLDVFNQEAQELEVYRIICAKEFNHDELRDDIALLKLAQKVKYTNYIQPVCLWSQQLADLDYVVGKKGTVVGWGLTEFDSLADTLKQGEMPVVSFATCLKSNRDFFGAVLNERNFCAGYRNGTSVCNGDSGGGIFFPNKSGVWFIRGVVSLSTARGGRPICDPEHYVVFTDVAKYLSWINDYDYDYDYE